MASFSDDEHFTLANIPFGIASRTGEDDKRQASTRIKEYVYFLPELVAEGHLTVDNAIRQAIQKPLLNELAGLGRAAHKQLRESLQKLLAKDESAETLKSCRAHKKDVTMHMPVSVGDFSDFSLSLNHNLNASLAVFGKEFLPPGFHHFPGGYAGRSSSVVVSGTPVRRPLGQAKSPDAGVTFGPSKAFDYELEVACVVGKSSEMGKPVRIDDALEHAFGFVLLNDWSARDIQGFEMQPLGPFNGKSAATTISPWIVTVDALEPFLVASQDREVPEVAYLKTNDKMAHYAVHLNVDLIESSGSSTTMCKSRLEWMYWTFKDMIAHQTINGCAIRSGDLLATGTVSGREAGTLGCLLEDTRGGKQAVKLSSGAERRYLEDGDAIRMTGWAGELGSDSCVGFGESYGKIEPALIWDDYASAKIANVNGSH